MKVINIRQLMRKGVPKELPVIVTRYGIPFVMIVPYTGKNSDFLHLPVDHGTWVVGKKKHYCSYPKHRKYGGIFCVKCQQPVWQGR